jgi:8-amino-7-oxononanoate synthase
MDGGAPFGLSGERRSQLLERLVSRRGRPASGMQAVPVRVPLGDPQLRADMRRVYEASRILGIENPYFRAHDGIAGAETSIDGRVLLNLVSYNYLGLNGDPRVAEAAKAAIDRYGTSVSASRLVSGERPVHGALETALARLYGAEDCLTFVSGHATNVTVIGALVGAGDAVVHDALAHNSIVQGAILSGAHRSAFAHNDLAALDRQLAGLRGRVKRILVVAEGHYSMDGDVPDLGRLAAIAHRHGAWLMVDEAHSLGVLGARGHGIAEHCGVDPSVVDIWMGTLSKTLCGCGGYIAGSRDLVEFLRYTAPGFVYSVGLSPPVAAASLAALTVMQDEPWRVAKLQENGQLFVAEARAAGLDVGASIGAAIVPVIVGSSIRAGRAADLLFRRDVNVQPILHPAVPERSARLRLFLSSLHTPEQIRRAVAAIAQAVEEVGRMSVDMIGLAAGLASGGGAADAS